MVNKLKTFFENSWNEFKASCFRRPAGSRLLWGLASIITFGFAYFFQINSGHSLPGDPWSNPMGQIYGAFATVGWIAGGFGLLLFSILGMKGGKEKRRYDESKV